MTRFELAQRIADAVAITERNFQRATGADWIEAYTRSWKIGDETYSLVLAPDRPVQFLPLRQFIKTKERVHECRS